MDLTYRNKILQPVECGRVLAVEGENLTEEINIACDELEDGYTYYMDISYGAGEGPYQLLLTPNREENTLHAVLTAEAIGPRGAHGFQIHAIDGDGKVAKSKNIVFFTINPAIQASESVPEFIPSEFSDFQALIAGIAADASDSADRAEEAQEQAENASEEAQEAADRAEEAVSSAQFLVFEVNSAGHLILTKNTTEHDVNFNLTDGGRLEVIIA